MIRAKVVSEHKQAVTDSKDAAKARADAVTERAEAVARVKALTVDGTVSFSVLDDAAKAELIDALVVLSGALQ